MKRDIIIHLEDILESADIIASYIKKVDSEKFSYDVGIQDKVLRRLAIIGEIARVMPNSFKDKHSSLPWEKISGMRNVIIHEYFGVKMERIWHVAKYDLPRFEKEIKKILENINKDHKTK